MGRWGDGVIMKKALCTLLAVSVYYHQNILKLNRIAIYSLDKI